jgi:hypothetical protein
MLAVILDQGDVFAGNEAMLLETVAWIVVFASIELIVEGPGAAWTSPQVTDDGILIGPRAYDATGVLVRVPECYVDPPILIEGSDKIVGYRSASLRVALFSGKFEVNPFELSR